MAFSIRHDESPTHEPTAATALASRFYRCFPPPFVDGQPGVGFFFAHARAQAVLHTIQHGIETRQGLVVGTSAAGLGKTTVLRAYVEAADPQRLKAIVPAAPPKTFQELLTLLSQELGIIHPTEDRVAMLFRLRQALLEAYREQQNVACFIDDAQELSVELLAEVVTLAHLDTGAGKLLQIVLLGRPELQRALKHPTVQNLTSRFVQCPTLRPLTKPDSVTYMQQCLAQSGAQVNHIFTSGAMKSIAAYGHGNPRRLNALCRRVLDAGAQLHEQPITAATAKQVIVAGQPRVPAHLRRWVGLGGLGLVCAITLALTARWYSVRQSIQHDTASPVPSQSRRLASPDSLLPRGDTGQALIPTTQPVAVSAPSQPVALSPHLDNSSLPSQATSQVAAPGETRTPLPPTSHTSAPLPASTTDEACLLNMLQGKPCHSEPLASPSLPHSGKKPPKP